MRMHSWIAASLAVLRKDWRTELRARHALGSVALFALSSLVVLSLALGPLGAAGSERRTVLPALLWILILFAAAAGIPRAFVHEEEARTAIALRLAATPSALFAGKLLYAVSLTWLVESLLAPLFLALMQLEVAGGGEFVAALLLGGIAVASASVLVAAIAAQAAARGPLFAVLAFPVLLPAVLLAVDATRAAISGDPAGPALAQLALYDGSVVVAGMMLFPALWNP
jgi:heme exporter protein B